MKTLTKKITAKSKATVVQSKSNLKAAFGKYKGVIVEKDDCWDDDLKKTIAN